ncbi:MAG: N-acetylmuramoyl-L-alanine amidase [Ignavibacteriales bacterium]|nr:N-acetylmuramoyl-L-alanine amidase [Ignavibacteriales bacterium]
MKRRIIHLKEGEFLREVFPKMQIVLHGTASSSGKYIGDWWNLQKGAIATAFAVEKNGELIELFPACYWAYHTGNGSAFDARNIGIEIVNEGYLRENRGNSPGTMALIGLNIRGKYSITGRIGGDFGILHPSQWSNMKQLQSYVPISADILTSKVRCLMILNFPLRIFRTRES